jgi:hypothetical protein
MKGISKNINHLLLDLPKGGIVTSSWLNLNGVSCRLQHHHSHSANAILKSIGTGAYALKEHTKDLKIEGGIYALQSQLDLDVHLGALSALGNIYNIRHFVVLANEKWQIFAPQNLHIPTWFAKNFGNSYSMYKTNFLPVGIGIQSINFRGFELKVSSPERAILESIFLSNRSVSLKEISQIMETMTNLRPAILQQLLENCTSVKVKRIFLYLAEKQKHNWFDFLKPDEINLGSGKRVISTSGKLNKKYSIVIDESDEI